MASDTDPSDRWASGRILALGGGEDQSDHEDKVDREDREDHEDQVDREDQEDQCDSG